MNETAFMFDGKIVMLDFSQSAFRQRILTEENNLPIEFTGKIKDKILLPQNISKSCKSNKLYKGLYFKYKNVPDQKVTFDQNWTISVNAEMQIPR